MSTLTDDSSPAGGPDLDYPSGMAFLPGGDIVITDKGHIATPELLRISPDTGNRAIVTGGGVGSGPTPFIGVMVAVVGGVIYLIPAG